jgi:hypothetical protein
MAFLYSYAEAAASLASLPESEMWWKMPLAIMDCYDWTDTCRKVNISTYPTVHIYRKGHERVEYHGMLSAKAVASTVRL